MPYGDEVEIKFESQAGFSTWPNISEYKIATNNFPKCQPTQAPKYLLSERMFFKKNSSHEVL